jgi:hypothetical protein
VEITKHFVRSPAAEQPNAVGVNIGAEERHSTGCPQGAG